MGPETYHEAPNPTLVILLPWLGRELKRVLALCRFGEFFLSPEIDPSVWRKTETRVWGRLRSTVRKTRKIRRMRRTVPQTAARAH